TLKSSESRAQYILELFHSKKDKKPNKLPPDLAMEYFELQEAMEEGQGADLKGFLNRLNDEKQKSWQDVDTVFSKWEQQGGKSQDPVLSQIAEKMDYLSYLDSMIRDLELKWPSKMNL